MAGEGIVPARLVFSEVPGPTCAGVLREMADRLVRSGVVADATALAQTLAMREGRCTTALGGGLAIPHGKLSGLSAPVVALGLVHPPADFSAADGIPVDLVFLLLSPAEAPAAHLTALSRLSRILRAPGVAARLRAAKDPAEVSEVLRETEAGLMVSSR